LTIKAIVNKFEENGLVISKTTVNNAIAGFSYSLKRLTVQVEAGGYGCFKSREKSFFVMAAW